MWNRRLGRTADHREALLKTMATDLILKGKIETTEMKAKELRSVVDELITIAKKNTLAARRQAAAELRDVIIPDMNEIRLHSDNMEMIAEQKAWPYPSYGEMLFSVR